MGKKGRMLAALAGVLIVAALAVTTASGAHRADPGVTATSISIGGTFPLTGVASLYKTIPAAEAAYFAYVNDHGGVNGRKINFTILDDGYNPAQTVPLTQQLVEQNKVFADFGSLGTAPNLSVWSYLNQNKVPQVLIATGDSYWGYSYKKYPWTIGYQPDYPGEAKVYGHVHHEQHAEREDRRPLPERRVRQELLRRPAGRARREEESDRERPVLRPRPDEPHAAAPRAQGGRSRHARHLRTADADDHRARDAAAKSVGRRQRR